MKLRKMNPLRMCGLLATADSKLLHITENNCNGSGSNRITHNNSRKSPLLKKTGVYDEMGSLTACNTYHTHTAYLMQVSDLVRSCAL
jgi:hypothetical protein